MVDHPLTHGDTYEAPRLGRGFIRSTDQKVRVNWIAVAALSFCAASWYGIAALVGAVF